MKHAHATPKNTPDHTGLKTNWSSGHSLPSFEHDGGGKEPVMVKTRQPVSRSLVFVDDLGTTLNEY